MFEVPVTPYLIGVLFFIITYLLITTPVYPILAAHCHDGLWARYTIAIIIGALAFITAAVLIRRRDPDVRVPA